MNAELVNPQDLTVARFLALFNQFNNAEQILIARMLWEKTFAEQWNSLDAEMPDVEMSEEEILNEIRAVRYGETKKIKIVLDTNWYVSASINRKSRLHYTQRRVVLNRDRI